MTFIELSSDSSVRCTIIGNRYLYELKEGDAEAVSIGSHERQPKELSSSTQVGRDILNEIKDRFSNRELKEKSAKQRYRELMSALQVTVDEQAVANENKAKDEAKELEEEYEEYFSNFEYNRDKYKLSRLQYIICVFEGLGVDAQLEMAKAYIGYLQTFLGLKGTNVIGVGSQSSGKTHILENPLDCIPVEYVHKGTFSRSYFFRKFGGKNLDSHIFYLQDLGGDMDDQNTIESRDVLKQMSTDGFASKGIVDEEGDTTDMIVTGHPAIAYTTVSEEIINEQERSRSVVIRPPDVNQKKLMMFDSFQESPGVKQDLKEQIESDKKDIQGFSWWLKKNIKDIEMFNPWMFCVQRFLSQMDDFNRKIKEFNMFLKVICILNDSFKLTHDLYDDFESDEFDITTTLLIPSKQDIIDALTLFEGSTGLLPSEIALARGILKIYQEFPLENLKEVNEDEELTFEERVIDSAIDDDTIISEQDEITGKYYLDGFQDAYLDDEGNQVYCFFTIDILKRGNSNSRWYRENKNNMSDKLYKLYNYGILIRIGQDKKGRNIYGIGENANNRINNTNPKFLKKDVDMAMHIFHERYPSLAEEFDLFVNKQKQLNVKNTNFEIKTHLYDLEWNNYKVDE